MRNKPKLGGFTSPYPKLQAVNIGLLERTFESGEVVTAKKLLEKNILFLRAIDSKNGKKIQLEDIREYLPEDWKDEQLENYLIN